MSTASIRHMYRIYFALAAKFRNKKGRALRQTKKKKKKECCKVKRRKTG